MRQPLIRAALWLAALCTPAAFAVPVNIAYTTMVTSNSGEATDGVVPPGTALSVTVRVDSESLLSGDFLAASGSAETAGAATLSLPIDRAGSGVLIAVPGASARVYSFIGTGPEFPADGDPPSADIWQWTSANLYLPPTDDLNVLLALTLQDINELIAAFGSMQAMTFTHSPHQNMFEFERARAQSLYSFSIELAEVPEPPLPALLALALAAAAFATRRAASAPLMLSLALAAGAAQAAYEGPTVAPRLFFTDLPSGPGRGGQDDLGAFVTIYGEGFGSTRGGSRVTIGGAEVARYVLWGEDNAVARGLDMIVVQPGPAAQSGDIVVTVNGLRSNPLPFTLRDGSIYFVNPAAANANDANPGSFAQPWRSIYRPRALMQPGDIVYLQGGTQTTLDPGNPSWDAILILDADSAASGTAERPIAYIGYPGQRPLFNNPAARRGILLMTAEPARDHYVLANLAFTQVQSALPITGTGHRIVGNHFHDGGFSDSGTIGVNGPSSAIRILGNLLDRNGQAGEKLHHGIYLGGFGHNRDIELGWNQIRDQRGGRAVQLFGHLDGDRIDDIRIHDNRITGAELNNVLLGGSDASTEVLGTVQLVNNVIAGAGEAGLRIDDPDGRVTIEHNTFAGNGIRGIDGAVQLHLRRAGAGRITLRNNILAAAAGQGGVLLEAGTGAGAFAAARPNLHAGVAGCPAWEPGCALADPQFVDATAGDYRLRAASPARDAGAAGGSVRDHAGLVRGAAPDLGAHEHTVFDAAAFALLADCLFGWAERQYPGLLAPAGAPSLTHDPYRYRHYPAQRVYVGASAADGQVLLLAPSTGGAISSVGALSGWLATAGCVGR
ncbi:right-handed parallel beta-helix repeat-containing protein [Aquincola sp. S2]|uniref:Right-handed parallel beta-helix repeat-containing protein n=1 Tax=Pseudaquabacterium terrae TaxID=2732868 RepID=A0ABX2EF31_9BURK|nr:IPT/TIG domain-containing protein [Aquabacterium terrae]NRF67235.1 right-handed parallel beta-helix repeat-containing protein [Aquabacterium terrae]